MNWTQCRMIYAKLNLDYLKDEIYNLKDLKEVLGITQGTMCYNRSNYDGIEALTMFLEIFPYPCFYSDLIPLFGRPVPEIFMISNTVLDGIYMSFHLAFTSISR